MTTTDLGQLLEKSLRESSNELSAKDLSSCEAFIEKLKKCGNLDVGEAAKKMARWRRSASSTTRNMAELTLEEKSTIDSLNRLYENVKTWDSPEYDRVRQEVNNICASFTKPVLYQICREFTGRGNKSETKKALIGYIQNPFVSRLQNRFMYS